jgi:hypothetical protein
MTFKRYEAQHQAVPIAARMCAPQLIGGQHREDKHDCVPKLCGAVARHDGRAGGAVAAVGALPPMSAMIITAIAAHVRMDDAEHPSGK